MNRSVPIANAGRAWLLLPSLLIITAIIVALSGCGSGGNTLATGSEAFPNAAIPPTPTAITQIQKTGPAYDLLRQAQQAMQGVTSYHFKLDNSVDHHTKEMNQLAAGDDIFRLQTIYEGDVEPPIARYWPNTDSVFSKMVVVGKDMFQPRGPFGGYHQLDPSGASWYYWINTAGLNNPEEFINFTLDKAQCATILGEELVDGVDTIHARYNLITDDLSVRSTDGAALYVRDYWIDKGTYYIRRLQTRQIVNYWGPCEQAFTWNDDTLTYTTGTMTYSKHNVPISPPIK